MSVPASGKLDCPFAQMLFGVRSYLYQPILTQLWKK